MLNSGEFRYNKAFIVSLMNAFFVFKYYVAQRKRAEKYDIHHINLSSDVTADYIHSWIS